jgi:hypothetical protein
MLGVELLPDGEKLRYRGQPCAIAELLPDLAWTGALRINLVLHKNFSHRGC